MHLREMWHNDSPSSEHPLHIGEMPQLPTCAHKEMLENARLAKAEKNSLKKMINESGF